MTVPSHTLQERLEGLAKLQAGTLDDPYSITHRLALANAYRCLGYPDLAAGDAYKALLLVDECAEEGEFHEEALEAATNDYRDRNGSPDEDTEQVVLWARSSCLKSAYEILIPCLIQCGSLRSAAGFLKRVPTSLMDEVILASYQESLDSKLRLHLNSQDIDLDSISIEDYPDKGSVRRELYPWNNHEPDRFSSDALRFLNDEMEHVAPKLEVKVAQLPILNEASSHGADVVYVKQLGVFAKEDISPGEEILTEKSLLTGISRLHDFYCDACSISLSDASDDQGFTTLSCEECEEVFFCSQECHDLAQDNYHPSLCGVVTEQKVKPSEVADILYTRLLIRAMALAETQDVHPLELKEVRYIWGDYHGLDLAERCKLDSGPFAAVPQTLAFSFEANILKPLHILEKMDVNIYVQSHRYDTWIFNTLYAKFRGTASGRQGLDGRPEICAVHPMWCLANHSCDPNVTWEWNGTIRFWAREQLVNYERQVPRQPGLKKGDEVFSHYCDIRLPVQERREWASGALGGLCVCPRCVWEDTQRKQ